jgi:hypothetical protein
MRMYRVAWKNTRANCSGNGEFYLTELEAALWVRFMNKKYPYINHWLEKELPRPNLSVHDSFYDDVTITSETF